MIRDMISFQVGDTVLLRRDDDGPAGTVVRVHAHRLVYGRLERLAMPVYDVSWAEDFGMCRHAGSELVHRQRRGD